GNSPPRHLLVLPRRLLLGRHAPLGVVNPANPGRVIVPPAAVLDPLFEQVNADLAERPPGVGPLDDPLTQRPLRLIADVAPITLLPAPLEPVLRARPLAALALRLAHRRRPPAALRLRGPVELRDAYQQPRQLLTRLGAGVHLEVQHHQPHALVAPAL